MLIISKVNILYKQYQNNNLYSKTLIIFTKSSNTNDNIAIIVTWLARYTMLEG